MTVLAIGATGFIGAPLVRHLVRRGHETVVFHRGTTDADLPESVQSLHGDRNDLKEHLQMPGDWRYELATDTGRIQDELGYEPPVTMEEALRRTVQWERAWRAESDAPAPDYEAEDAVLQNWA